MKKDEFTARVAALSNRLEEAIMTFRPVPTAELISVTTLHWAARSALAGGDTTEAEFLEGAKAAWAAAIKDFRSPFKG